MGIIKGISVFPPLPFSCIVLRLFSPPCSSFLPAWLRSTVLSEKEQSLSGPQAVRQPIRTGDGFRVLGLGPRVPNIPLIREYGLNYRGLHIMTYAIFLN